MANCDLDVCHSSNLQAPATGDAPFRHAFSEETKTALYNPKGRHRT
eukprot:jgi/Antlo1/1003/2285